MIKRLVLAAGILLCLSAPTWAACAITNLQVKDNAAVTAAVPYADDGSGASNCSPQIQIKQAGHVAAVNASGQLTTIEANSAAILAALGAPFQASASIGNTGFNALQGDIANAAGNPFFVSPGTGATFSMSGTVTANAGTNLNTSALALSANQPTNAAQASTTSGQTGALVEGAATTAAPTYTTGQTNPLSLDTAGSLRVNCTSGCGGGSGGTASNFGSTFPAQGTAIGLTNGTNMVAWSAASNYGTSPGAIAVPAVNAFVTNTPAVTQSGSWTNTVTQATGSNLHVVCDSGCSSSTAPADESAFTFGTTSQSPIGGVFQTTATSNPLTTGQMGAWQFTAQRAGFVNLRNASGTEIGTSSNPVQVSVANTGANGTAIAISAASLPLPSGAATAANQGSISTWAAGTLGAMANYGTSPGAVLVPGVNAFITNVPAVSQSGTWTVSAAAGTNVVGFTSNDPCAQATKLGAPISLTASGQIITGTAAKKTYICSLDIVSATAQNIALVEGTGTTCATNIFGIAGGTTAATGWNLAANGGLTKGAGAGTVYSPSADTNGTAANVCLLLSSTGQTSGQITYVQQ